MAKSREAFRTISEVAEGLGTQPHVLRFWESKFSQIKPVKRAGGRRYYRPADVALIGGVKKLLHEDGLTIKGVQKILRERGVKYVAALSPDAPPDVAADVVIDANVVKMERVEPDADPVVPEAAVAQAPRAGAIEAPPPAEIAEPDETGHQTQAAEAATDTDLPQDTEMEATADQPLLPLDIEPVASSEVLDTQDKSAPETLRVISKIRILAESSKVLHEASPAEISRVVAQVRKLKQHLTGTRR